MVIVVMMGALKMQDLKMQDMKLQANAKCKISTDWCRPGITV